MARLREEAQASPSRSSQPPQSWAAGHPAGPRRGSLESQASTSPSPWRAFQRTAARTVSPGKSARGAESSTTRPSSARPTPRPPQARRSIVPCHASGAV